MLKKILTLISAAAIIAMAGCAPKAGSQVKSDTAVKPVQPSVAKLKITPLSGKTAVGTTVKFEVVGLDATGKTVIISADWKLITGKTVIGTLDSAKGNAVIFTAKAAGNTTLEAEYNKIKASAAIEVVKKK